MINSITIQGNLTRDAEIRTTQAGGVIGNLSIAVNDRRRSKEGEWEERPSFFDAKLFGPRAEKLSPYLTKGKRVTIQGKLRQDRWDDKETGQPRSAVYIVVDELEFASSRNAGSEQARGTQAQQQAPAPVYVQQPQAGPEPIEVVAEYIEGDAAGNPGEYVEDAYAESPAEVTEFTYQEIPGWGR